MSIPAPSSPPQNFTAAALSPNSITLTWSPPPLHSSQPAGLEYPGHLSKRKYYNAQYVK